MTVRVFNGTSGVLVLDEGTLDNVLNSAFTIAVLFKKTAETTDVTQFLISLDAGTNSNQRGCISLSGANAIQLTVSGITRTFGLTISNDTWYLVVVKKAAGTATPRANLFDYTAGTWAGWADGNDTLDADGTALTEVRLGNGPGGFPLSGKLGGAVVYATALSDTDGETLETSAQNWVSLSPAGMWRLNQASTATAVTDDTGNGADQTSLTNTSVDEADDPAGFDFILGAAGPVVGYQTTAVHPGAGPSPFARFIQRQPAYPPSTVQTVEVGQASESDAAQPVGRLKARIVGQGAETDTALPVSAAKARGMGQATETDTAQPVGRSKVRVLGQVAEADTAQPVGWPPTRLVHTATESDAAQPVTGRHTRTVGQPAESDTAQPVTAGAGLTAGVLGVSGDTLTASVTGDVARMVVT